MCFTCGTKYDIRLLKRDGEIMARLCGYKELTTIDEYFDYAKDVISAHGIYRSNVKTIQIYDWSSETIVASKPFEEN